MGIGVPMNSPADATSTSAPLTTTALVKRLLRLAWRYRGRCLGVMARQVVMLMLGLLGLSLTGLGIDFLRHVADPAMDAPHWPFGLVPAPDRPAWQVVVFIAIGIVVFAAIRMVLNYSHGMAVGRLSNQIVVDLRTLVYAKLQRLSFRFYDANSTGSIINRVTGDVQAVRMFVDGVFIQAFIMLISLGVYFAYMARLHLPLTLACLATTPLLWVLSANFSRAVRPRYARNRELMDALVLDLAENIQGIQTVKGFGLESKVRERFAERNDEVLRQRQTIFRRVSLFGPTVHIMTHLNIAILLGYGGWLVIQGQMPLGTGLVVFAGLLQQFSGQISNLAGLVDNVQQSLAGARRVFEVLDTEVEVSSPAKPVRLGRVRGEIEFERVSFDYHPGAAVLRDVSFRVAPGEMVAMVGATGAGKSALMSLLPRFYDPHGGVVKLDGRDLRSLDLDELRRSIGLVFQESFLFSTTVAGNISFGYPEATREEIEKAARVAQAHDFIMELPKGYDTVLAESGSNLSGGQRQRLAIARAVLREPAILLLDDPTAAIDPETEHEILAAIDSAIAGRTTFVVAHRLSTLRRADRIFVLERGQLVETGTHDELMARPGPYLRAASLQMVDPESMALLKASASRRREGRDA